MSELREELIESRLAFQGKLLRVRIDHVRLADGTAAVREIVAHPGAVAAVPLIGDEVVLVRQWRQAIGRETIEIPAGTLEPGEAPESCIVRELQEEIAYKPERLELLLSVALAPGYSSEVIHIFLADELTPSRAQRDFDERLNVVRMAFDEALQRSLAGELGDAKTVVGIVLAAARMGKLTKAAGLAPR